MARFPDRASTHRGGQRDLSCRAPGLRTNLEASRLPKDDNEAFAYRFAEGESLRVFELTRGYHQWLAHLSEFGGPENPFAEDRPAIVTDISDFYQRIYFHRVENVLQDAGCSKGPSDLVKKIIKTTRARQSYGLPVGTTGLAPARRMPAERYGYAVEEHGREVHQIYR
jgi:hypothetical protein